MKRFYLLSICLLMCLTDCVPQQTISIKVVDSRSSESLAYTYLYLNANRIGFATDVRGVAVLKLSKGFIANDTLTISYIGYRDTLIYIDLSKTDELIIKLHPEPVMLKKVLVKGAVSGLTAEEIIKYAIKKIKKNYSKKSVRLCAFYRELFLENGKHVELNEAIAEIFYTKYPQKNFTSKSFRQYWKNDYSGKQTNRYVEHLMLMTNAQYFKYYNSIDDQCKIIGVRLSENFSSKGITPHVQGGPLGLTSADKVKFLSDFFDPKLMKQYRYSKNGASLVEGHVCYAINVKPRHSVKRIFQPWNKKMKYPIFSGTIYVDMESFAIVSFNCQLSSDVDYGSYKNGTAWQYFPSVNSVQVKYQKAGNIWILKRISTSQTVQGDGHSSNLSGNRYTVKRELFVHGVTTDAVTPYDKKDPALFEDKNNATLAKFPDKYDKQCWGEFLKTGNYPDLSNKAKKELEEKMPLSLQWNKWFVQQDMRAPIAARQKDTLAVVFDTCLIDEYKWMEDYNNPSTQEYINKENAYFYNSIIPLKKDQFLYYKHILNSLAYCDTLRHKTDKSVYKQGTDPNGHFGWIEEDVGGGFVRMLIDFEKDKNTGQVIRQIEWSPDKTYLAFQTTDKKSKNRTWYFKNIKTQMMMDSLPADSIFEFMWSTDSSVIYTVEDKTKRPYRLYEHILGKTDNSMLFETMSNQFELEIIKLYSHPLMFLLNCTNVDGNYLYLLRQKENMLTVEEIQRNDFFSYAFKASQTDIFILARGQSQESLLLKIDINNVSKKDTLVKAQKDIVFDQLLVTSNYYLIKAIENAEVKLLKFSRSGQFLEVIKTPELHHAINLEKTVNYDENICRYTYSSPNIPPREYNIDLSSGETFFVPLYCLASGGEHTYTTRNYFVEAADGSQIPLRVTYRNDFQNIGMSNTAMLFVYGAYGAFNEASFDEYHRFLMDNGIVVCNASVRGSRAKGWAWYRDGKLMNKQKAISDFLSCAMFLKNEINIEQIIAYGQSAGAVIVGGALNEQPSLFDLAILDYPFMDVLTSMLADTLPLTTLEYAEWGNPKIYEQFSYILDYSPYQNISDQAYPPLLLLCGRLDFQTPYWHTLKSLAAYRSHNISGSVLMAHINSTSHPGKILYRERIKEMVYQYLFIRNNLKLNEWNGNR